MASASSKNPLPRPKMSDGSDETALARKRRARKINRVLAEVFPYAHAELDFDTPFELLVATVLSAQTTDIRVNSVTPALFARFPDAEAMAVADERELQELVRPTGFYRNKASSILRLSQALVSDHDGEVPGTLKELTALPGVGRKTAFVVLGNAFDLPGITVDTHMIRLAQRLGFTQSSNANVIERDLGELIERSEWTMFSHRIIFLGRRVCHARTPACGACPIAQWCPSYGVGETEPEAAADLLSYELAPGREHILEQLRAGVTRRELTAQGYRWQA